MSAYGSWSQPFISQGESYIYFEQPKKAALPQQMHAGQKHASRHHKKHGTSFAKSCVTLESIDIPADTPCPTGGALCFSIISALAFTCALVFHGIMFYYALETPMWIVMCWPLLLIPPIIFNSVYLAFMAKKVSGTPNTKMLFLYVLFAIAYMAWASYVVATTFQEGRCDEGSYYSLVVSILALATVACTLEWWMTISKIVKHTAAELNVAMAVYEKSPTKRKLVVSLKNNGKVVKEVTYNMEKFIQDYNMKYSEQYTAGGILLFNNPAHYGNEKYKQCPMKYHGQRFAPVSPFGAASCHYENEKLNREWPMKYARECLGGGAPLKNDLDQQETEKLRDQFSEESETDNSSVNGNISQNNKTA